MLLLVRMRLFFRNRPIPFERFTNRFGKFFPPVPESSELFYDLKQMLVSSLVSTCPQELANHPEAQNKPGRVVQKKQKDVKIFM